MFANTVTTILALLALSTHSTDPTSTSNPKKVVPGEDILPENINNTEPSIIPTSDVGDEKSDRLKEDQKMVEDLKTEIIKIREVCDKEIARNHGIVKVLPFEKYINLFMVMILFEKKEVFNKMVSFFVTNYLDNPMKHILIIETLYNWIINSDKYDYFDLINKNFWVLVDIFLEFLRQKKERAGNDIKEIFLNNQHYIRCVLKKNEKIVENKKIRNAYAEILADSIEICNSYDANNKFCKKKTYKDFKKRTFKLKDWFVKKCEVLKDNENLEKFGKVEKTHSFRRILKNLKSNRHSQL